MLDDIQLLTNRDSEKTLETTAMQADQARMPVEILSPEYDGRDVDRVVLAGMGGSALAAELAKTWLYELTVPFEIVRNYSLPNFVDASTLVIASSCSGNTEETLTALHEARSRGAQVAIISGGGKLGEIAREDSICRIDLPDLPVQPRMLTIAQLRGLTALLAHFGVVSHDRFGEICDLADWLSAESQAWTKDVSTDKNYAKQLALQAVGKTPVFYGGPLTSSAAYKWKISWNENAKNTAFWNQYPEVSHNEFIGWSSHPVEKPFAVFDLVSELENPRILERFRLTDRLLSGKRPKATEIQLSGDSLLKQLLWANILADFASIYTGILNNVDPGPVELANTLKHELADS